MKQSLFLAEDKIIKVLSLCLLLSLLKSDIYGQLFSNPVANPFSLKPKAVRITPCFADLDGDNDLDLLTGGTTGVFQYYQNIGSVSVPKFTDPLVNAFGLKNSGAYSKPVFGDLDGDGDYDVLVGSERGDLEYYQNTGTKTAPKFANVVLNPFSLNENRKYLTPFLVDLDGDNDLDLIAGTEINGIAYQENIGTAHAPKFATIQFDPFNILSSETDLIPALADIDNDGDLDLIVANQSPSYQYYENIGTKSQPVFASPRTNPFSIKPNSGDPSPFLMDLDHDGDMDLLSGQTDRFNYYENTQLVNKTIGIYNKSPIQIFPNPVNSEIVINSTETFSNCLVELYDLNQRFIRNIKINPSEHIDVQDLPAGEYYLKIRQHQNLYSIKFAKK
jgi:hypothetical protein